jgi:hypothetical protein
MLIGLSLSLMVMAAILASYVFLARNFTRSLGVTYAVNNQTTLSQLPPLEAQLRTTLAYFTQDVRMATGISGTFGKAVRTASRVAAMRAGSKAPSARVGSSSINSATRRHEIVRSSMLVAAPSLIARGSGCSRSTAPVS